MKSFLLLILYLISCNFLCAQSVGIGTTTPNSRAILDLTSIDKGILIPRMTTIQRNNIVGPPIGLMVFDTNLLSFYFFNGSGWSSINTGAGSSAWTLNGTDITNNNTGNVGIGISLPNEKMDIEGNLRLSGGASRSLKLETTQATSILTTQRPGISFIRDNNTLLARMEYVDTFGLANFMRLRMGENIASGLTINTSNNVGVGTVDPSARIHISGGSGEQLRITEFSNPFVQFTTGGGQFAENKKGFLDVSGDDFRVGTNTENNAGKFIVRVNGNNILNVTPTGRVGIGTSNPSTSLHVIGNTIITGITQIDGGANIGGNSGIDGDLTLDAVNPTIQLQNSNVDKGFVQLSGDHLRIGTNSGNAAGKFVIRTNGGDRFFVDGSGNVNIGSQTDAAGYILRVGGRMICEEVKVKLQTSTWPDYVFAENYKLPALSEVDKFIKLNKHLPNIPSAAEVAKNGLELGDMQNRMMEKIEELTLYIIQQQKEIDYLKTSIKKLN